MGRFHLSCIANVDQTPLPFSFTGGPTCNDVGSKSVWVRAASSGLDKRQCTVQLTLFADGVSRVKPLVIFEGKVKRIPLADLARYGRRDIHEPTSRGYRKRKSSFFIKIFFLEPQCLNSCLKLQKTIPDYYFL